MEDTLIHISNGSLISPFDVEGTVVRRKQDLPYPVHTHFPVGETKVVGPPCGNVNYGQDLDREIVHIPVEENLERRILVPYCFHPYRDTLEVVMIGEVNT